jgi:hypothetical protein
MKQPLGFEYAVLQHYFHKGMWARAALVDLLIKQSRKYSERANRKIAFQQFDLNDSEVIAVLQVTIISHIMMFIEDLAIICKSISEGKTIDYYKYLDKSEQEDLGVIISNFWREVNRASDDQLSKILSFAGWDSSEYIVEDEKMVVSKIINDMLGKTRAFFTKVTMFRENHIKLFRRYKHAGFPILLAQAIPSNIKTYGKFEFVSIALTSPEKLSREVVPIPYSAKAIESYENLKKDLFSFLGNVLHFKLICMERRLNAVVPHKDNVFGLKLSEAEITVLDNIWNRLESKDHVPEGKNETGLISWAEILGWYEQIEDNSRRILF